MGIGPEGDNDTEQLRALAESTETSAGVNLYAAWYDLGDATDVELDSESEPSDLRPHALVSSSRSSDDRYAHVPVRVELPMTAAQGRPRTELGDLYALRAEEVLNRCAPYCCAEVNFDGGDDYDANVYCTSPLLHVIMHYRFDTLIESGLLKDPDFDLPRWYRQMVVHTFAQDHQTCYLSARGERMGHALAIGACRILEAAVPWPNPMRADVTRFTCIQRGAMVRIFDMYLSLAIDIPTRMLGNIYLDLPNYYAVNVRRYFRADVQFSLDELNGELACLFRTQNCPKKLAHLELNAVSARRTPRHDEPDQLVALQQNAAAARDFKRLIPEPIVVVVYINGHPARAMLDSGSLSDFMSAKMAHQLGVHVFELEKPLPVHLAVQGSRAKINFGCRAAVEYQRNKAERYFDVVNLLNYDLILVTPFLFQHKVPFSFNPTAVIVGSSQALPIEGKTVRVLQSHAADVWEHQLESARSELREYAAPICKEASDSPLPPLRSINHRIPLLDDKKTYTWRPSKCPDALRALWAEKRDTYLKSGRWRMTSARNTSPMLLLTKPGTGTKGVPPRLRVVCDLRERNANTQKVTSPLPDMKGILRRIARRPYRSMIDDKDAYE